MIGKEFKAKRIDEVERIAWLVVERGDARFTTPPLLQTGTHGTGIIIKRNWQNLSNLIEIQDFNVHNKPKKPWAKGGTDKFKIDLLNMQLAEINQQIEKITAIWKNWLWIRKM